MAWTNVPPPTGTDINAYAFVGQFWQAVQERYWGAAADRVGGWAWPASNWLWGGAVSRTETTNGDCAGTLTGFNANIGTVTGLTDNGDGTYAVADANAAYVVNRYFGWTNPSAPWEPANYDLVFDDPTDETQVVHAQILGNTATTFHITGQQIADALTGKFLGSAASLVGRRYWVIKQGGEWWSERWLVWPNDSEAWVGTTLGAGAILPVTLTSSGTTATATLATGHGFINGDPVTIAGAVSSNGHYNGTFTISGVTATTFQYTLAAPDSSPAAGSPTATYQFNGSNDPQANYPSGKFATGYELMVKGSDGALKRIAITGNDNKNLHFARQTYTPASGQYAVIKAGQKWRYYNSTIGAAASTDGNPYAGPPFRWYHSFWDHYLSHYPDDSIQATPVPATTIQIANSCIGGNDTVAAFDVDVWTDFDDTCHLPDKNFTPDFFRTLHALQVATENVCTSYVKAQSYEGAKAIPVFVPALLFQAAGINAFTSTTTTVGTDIHGNAGINIGSVTLPTAAQAKLTTSGSIPVYYAVLDANGTCQNSGTGTLTSNTFLTGTFIACPSIPWCDEGKSIVLSLGFTRNFPSEFLYMYDRTAFIAGVDATPAFVDPPTTSFPGTWAKRAKSTKYKEHDNIGIVRDANGWKSFATNDYVRYVGDNANDPTIHTGLSGTTPPTLSNDQEENTASAPVPDPSPYFDNFYEGLLSPANQGTLNGSRGGAATSGDSYSLQDTSKNWWPRGVMRTETGTASGGGTTSLTDSSKAGNAFWNAATGRWAGFTLEMQIGGVWYRRPIASMSGTTLSWTEPLQASCSGCTYQIREPKYVLNRWLGRSVRVTLPGGGGTFTIPILYSDDQNLYFAQQTFAIAKGTSYQIIENTPGGVWKWDPTTVNPNNNTHWNVPTGTDARGGVPWLANQTCNIPTYRTDYGHVMKGDYITPGMFTELYNAINALVWAKWPMSWTGRPANTCNHNHQNPPGISPGEDITDPGVSNGATACQNGYTDGGGTHHSGAKDQWTQDLYTNPDCCDPGVSGSPDGIPDYLYEDDNAPYAESFADNGQAGCCFSCNYRRRFAYGAVRGIIPYQSCGVDWYAYADVQGTATTDCNDAAHPGQWTTFNAEGDGVLFQEWHKFATSAPSNAEHRISPVLGSLAMPASVTVPQCGAGASPAPPSCPGADPTLSSCYPCMYSINCGTTNNPSGVCSHWDGYLVTDQAAILTWNNAAGFRKY